MNRLSFSVGGIRLTLNDVLFMHDAHEQALNNLLSGLGSEVVVSGCEVTEDASNFYVATGFVCINNEFCYVPALTCVKTVNSDRLEDFGLKIIQTDGGVHNLVDGGTHNVRLTRPGTA